MRPSLLSSSSMAANLLGKREPGDDLWTKPILKKHKEISEEKETVEVLDEPLVLADERVEGVDEPSHDFIVSILLGEPPDFIEEVSSVAVRKKTLFVARLSPQTEISDIINLFKDVGEVVHVRLVLNHSGNHVGFGFVEFTSAIEAMKALEKKRHEILCGSEIFLGVAKNSLRHKYSIDHRVCYEDHLRRESLLIGEAKDETVEGLDESAEAVLFVSNLSPQSRIVHINKFFNFVGEVVSVRLIVNHDGKHVGCGFVEFASANEAKKALEEKNGEYLNDHKTFLQVAKIAPYPPRHKYNLAEMLCYQDYVRRESLLIGEDETVEGLSEDPDSVEAVAVAIREKTLFVADLSPQTGMSDVINFFKDVGEVVHVRLILDDMGKDVEYGFVEFASAKEAEKALEKKKGKKLLGHKIVVDMAEIAPCPPPKYCIDHKVVLYEHYLRRERLVIEKYETVEGHNEPPDFIKEAAARKKSLFLANLCPKTKILHIYEFFKNVGEVVSVRLIVNDKGERVGCGFVEFASANEAQNALQKRKRKNLYGYKIFLQVAKIAPYPPRPKYTLSEMLWYEHYLRPESLVIEDSWEIPPKPPTFSGKKITFSDDDD